MCAALFDHRAPALFVRTITYLCNAPYIAVRGDGAVVVTEATNVGLASVTLNGQMYSIPPSTVTNYGNTIDVLCCVGPPMVNTDGTAYLEYEVRNTVNNVVTSDTLYLMQINPDNSFSSTILSATTQNETQYPGNIIPDGNGGVLATWSVSVVQGTQPTYPYQVVDVSGGAVGTPYNLPFSPQSVDITKQPDLVLGENGVAFAKGQTTVPINGVQTTVDQIASFNIGSGAANWTYQATPGDTLSIIEATDDGGVTINDFNNGVIQLSSGGAFNSDSHAVHPAASRNSSALPSGTSSLPSGAVPFDYGTWVAPENGAVASLWAWLETLLRTMSRRLSPSFPKGANMATTQPATGWKNEWFEIDDAAYLNTAAHAAVPRVSLRAVQASLEAKKFPHHVDDSAFFEVPNRLRASIARLIGSKPEEVALTLPMISVSAG